MTDHRNLIAKSDLTRSPGPMRWPITTRDPETGHTTTRFAVEKLIVGASGRQIVRCIDGTAWHAPSHGLTFTHPAEIEE